MLLLMGKIRFVRNHIRTIFKQLIYQSLRSAQKELIISLWARQPNERKGGREQKTNYYKYCSTANKFLLLGKNLRKISLPD